MQLQDIATLRYIYYFHSELETYVHKFSSKQRTKTLKKTPKG